MWEYVVVSRKGRLELLVFQRPSLPSEQAVTESGLFAPPNKNEAFSAKTFRALVVAVGERRGWLILLNLQSRQIKQFFKARTIVDV
jgi:hypothetical protein